MSKLTVLVVLIACLVGLAASRPRKVNSLYPGSYYQPKEPKAEPLVSQQQQPEVDRFFESFDNFDDDDDADDEDQVEEQIEAEEPRELVEDEPEPSGRAVEEEIEALPVPNSNVRQQLPSESQPRKLYEDEEPAASNLGYFRGYAPRSIVLTDDTAFEARFPFPQFPKFDFPFDKPFHGK